MKYIRMPRSRAGAQIGRNFSVNTKYARKSSIHQAINVFNVIPEQLKIQDKNDFKKMLKKVYIDYKPD